MNESVMGLVGEAEWAIIREFREYYLQHRDTEEWFWDPRNRDEMMRSFAEWLARPREHASNE